MSVLLPEGVTDLNDIPYPLQDAIRAALVYLSYEELPTHERPPRDIWLDSDRMQAWWADVERSREAEMKGEGGGRGGERNSYADELIR